jgi:tetratricopeptide (TPR) repeat protein
MARESLRQHDEALKCYDKAIGLDANDKISWNSKGLVLMEMGKYDNAIRSFERALELDPDFGAAQDGLRIAREKISAQDIEKYARLVLSLEHERDRPVTREEAFKECGISSANLEPVFSFLNQMDTYPLEAMNPQEKEEMESASKEVLVRSIGSNSGSQKTRLRLSDIAFNFPDYSLWKAKRVLAYIQRVDQMTFAPVSTPEMDALLRRALDLPAERRTVIGLVESLGLGVMKAKQLQAHLAIFRKDGYEAPEVEIGSLVSEEYGGKSATKPPKPKPTEHRKPEPAPHRETHGSDPGMAQKFCTSHGHMAVTRHHCGAYLCHNCVSGASKCPICHQPLHGKPVKELPVKLERQREPEEMEPDDDDSSQDDEPQQDNRPRSDEEVRNEYSTL